MQALYRHDMEQTWDAGIAPHRWNQYQNQIAHYLALAPAAPADILDVGCAQGTLALLLAERGHRVTAVDLRQDFLDYAASRHTHGDVRFLQGNVLDDDIPGAYDLVFANQIIEHLVHPRELVSRLRRNLRPGGRLVVTTPNGAYLRNSLPSFAELGDVRQWEHRQHTADGDGHFFAYRAHELTDIVRGCGFTQLRTIFFETPMISGHMKVRHLHRHVPAGVLRRLDRMVLAVPWLGPKAAHQLLVTGIKATGP